MTSREVVVNGRFLSRRVTGVERYAREILALLPGTCRLEGAAVHGWRGHAWEQFVLPRKVGRRSVLWSPANTGPFAISNQALTVHDLSPLDHPGWFRRPFAAWYRLFLPCLIRRVPLVFTPSEHGKRELCRRFGLDTVIVTPNGVDPARFHPAARQETYALPRSYILFVGTLEPRKNLGALLQAWDRIKQDFRDTWLILAGAPGRVFRPLEWPAGPERVRFLGYVDEQDLPGLYSGATLFVLPSFDEGFGLPVLEAMACGTPVLASDGGALPEVVGSAGAIFGLSDPDALSAGIREYLSSQSLRRSMRERGLERITAFTWKRSAEIVWEALHGI